MKAEPSSKSEVPRPVRVAVRCGAAVAGWFLLFEIVERAWLPMDQDVRHALHIVRGLVAASIGAGVALLSTRPRPGRLSQPPGDPRSLWDRAQHLSLRAKLAVPIVVFAVVPALVIGGFAMITAGAALRQRVQERIAFDTETRADGAERFLGALQEDLRFLASSSLVREAARHLADPAEAPAARDRLEHELLIFARGRRAYYQLRYVEQGGLEVVRLNSAQGIPVAVRPAELQRKGDRYYVRDAMELPSGGVYVSAVDLNEEHGRVEAPPRWVLRLATRISDDRGVRRGLLVVNLDVVDLFSELGKLPEGTVATLFDAQGAFVCDVWPSGRVDSAMPPADLSRLREAAGGGASRGSLLTGASVLSFARLRAGEGARSWVLGVATPREPAEAPVASLVNFVAAITTLLAAAAVVAGVLVAAYVTRPIASVREAARRVGAGELGERVEVQTGDELEALALEFNAMTHELEAARGRLAGFNDELAREVAARTDELRRLNAGLARVDKLASMGQMAAAVMHELGNPLAAIKTRLQLELETDGDPRRSTLLAVLAEVDRLTAFLRTFIRVGRANEPAVVPLSLADVLQSVETLLGPSQASHRVAVRFGVDPGLPSIAGDSDQLRQLLLNLVLNAIEASAPGQAVSVRARSTAAGVELSVEDRGRGMPPDVLARAGEPFFTTTEGGTGLGLAISREVAMKHDASFEVSSAPGEGTTVRVTFKVNVAGKDR